MTFEITSNINVLKGYLDQAAEKDALIVFFSHDISPNANGVHMRIAWLEELLKHARMRNMNIVGVSELNSLRKKQ